MDPVPHYLFSENLVALGIDPRTSRSLARNSGQQTTDAVNLGIKKSEFIPVLD
jgi:hypothetical protein